MSRARIVGWGKHLPSKVVTNDDLALLVATSDEWIRSRTGIQARRIAQDDEGAASLGALAARAALTRAGIAPTELDLIICATATPDRIFPATASLIQHAVGATRAAAFDLSAACSGFVYALVTAAQFIASGAYRTVLVVGSEVYSRIIDWSDRSTCVLFGDGAGAMVLQATEEPEGLLSFTLGSDGSGADLLYVPCATGPVASQPPNGRPALQMAGGEVFKFAVQAIGDSVRAVAANAGVSLDAIDLVIAHQANERILRTAAKQLGLPARKFYQNLQRYGNTSAASIPIAFTEAIEEGKLRPGDRVVLVGFGGGLSWGAALIQFGVRSPAAPRSALPASLWRRIQALGRHLALPTRTS
ncbi:MAG: 3-oxoacyl-[acyl-carrier-protein] synthase 3 protein 1 [Dehalococcoidia bacterium]|nr:MAG: 3-oxoacyl-[acyl-carrier-protein] synthase 3 protein 1 [Dehalococcoidia bacterium]